MLARKKEPQAVQAPYLSVQVATAQAGELHGGQ